MRSNRAHLAALFLIPILTLAACSDPAADKPKARVSEPAPAAAEPAAAEPGAAPAPQAAGETLPLTLEGSRIGFIGSKVTGSHVGEFKRFSGTIELADGAPAGGKVAIEIDMSSVETDRERLTGHLKSADFFDVAAHPQARFESTEVRATPGNPGAHTVTGTLTLHGIGKQIEFPAVITVDAGGVRAESEFSINRRDFAVNYDGKADDLIRDDVVIQLDIRARRAG